MRSKGAQHEIRPPPRVFATIIALAVLIAIPAPLSRADSPTYTPATFSCDNVTEIPKSECEALVALYNSTNGPGWKNNTGWLQTNTPCSWFRVKCIEGHVQKLSLYWNELSGPIPKELGNLVKLEELMLIHNSITGAIPSQLSALTALSVVYLDENMLTGSIPPQLADLPALRILSLANNQLSGNIPPDLGRAPNLSHLFLYSNQLAGPIPSELGDAANLKSLSLNDNLLTGRIPSSLGRLANLSWLHLEGNRLSGSLPPSLGTLTNLFELSLARNQLTGTIPSELGALAKLVELDLGGNQLTGSVPTEIGSLYCLRKIHLNDNSLSGPLPLTLTALRYVSEFDYHATDTCEPPDTSFQTWLLSLPHLLGTDITCGSQTVTGLVWNDTNRNGAQDAGEAGLAGATVTLTQTQTAAAVDAAGRRVFTDQDGRYRFDYVATGAHTVSVAKPGFLPTSGATFPINVPEGGLIVPPVGIAWAPAHIFLPLTRR